MKKLLLDGIVFIGRALALSLVFSATSFAAPAASNQSGSTGGEFNHMTTGFALSGGHAVAACESCHVGGVFKGTPKNCDGCHAVGQRVVATPKHSSHIVTDAPCETCHFNTSTFLGARFNHGMAQTGKCQVCHNGRQSTGKPASHNSGRKATESCDSCHRTYAWYPNSWNHNGVMPGTCTTCHGVNAIGKPGSHTTFAKATYQCDECHNFTGWLPARFKHNTSATCSSCHNDTIAIGKPLSHGPAAIKGMDPCENCHRVQGWLPARYNHTGAGTCSSCHDGIKAVGARSDHLGFPGWPLQCNECHLNTISFAGALGARPANHILYNAGVKCSSCHLGTGTVARGATLHAFVSSSCKTCHDSNVTTNVLGVTGRKRLGDHKGSSTSQDCTTCHIRQYNFWNEP